MLQHAIVFGRKDGSCVKRMLSIFRMPTMHFPPPRGDVVAFKDLKDKYDAVLSTMVCTTYSHDVSLLTSNATLDLYTREGIPPLDLITL